MEDIRRGYTLDQLAAFSEAAGKNRRREMLELTMCVRMATQAPKGPYRDFVKKLSQGLDSGGSPTVPRPLDKAGVERLKALLGRKPGRKVPARKQ